MNQKNDYRIIKLPAELAEKVDEMLGKMGYRTRTEFVKDAVRRLLQTYGVPPTKEHTLSR